MEQQRILCRVDEVPEGGSKGVTLTPGRHYADLVLARRAGAVYVYANRCPHTGAPMEWQPDRFMDFDGEHLICGIHGALFRVEDGYCVRGPCARRSLAALPAEVRDGAVVVGAAALEALLAQRSRP